MPRGASRPVRRRKAVSHYSDDNPSTFTVKRRKGDPPVPDSIPSPSTSTSCPPSRKRKAIHKRRLPEPEYDTILAHRSRIQTILPVQEFLSSSNSRNATNITSLPPTFGIPLPPSPTWKEFNTHDYDESITWLSIRQDDPSYAVAGTVHGTLFLLSQHSTILQRIHTTSAAQRDTGRKNCNAIVQAVWSHDHVVVVTRSELEWIALLPHPSKIVSTHSISTQQQQQRTSQSPVLSLRGGRELLWCDGQQRLWRGTNEGVLTPLASSLRCWTVLWETVGDTFLLVTSGESVELLRCRYKNGDNNNDNPDGEEALQILIRRTVPSGRNVDCTIQQFDTNGSSPSYTFVCGRGIRMYQTQDLALLQTFGESVQLHGQTTLWSRCCWLRRPDFARKQVKSTKRMFWLEKEDVLAPPTATQDDDTDDEREFWLIGIPHPRKGPLELQSTFYFLSPNHATTTTRDGPPKGCLGDVWVDRDRWSITAVSAEKGRLMELSPNIKTDFPGVMYPVGFNEIDNNIEYIEDEDELDESYMDDASKDLLDDDTDPELVEAMRQSLLEAQAKQPQPEDDRVHVMASPPTTTTDVAAWPEISRSDSSDSGGGSPLRRGTATDSLLPLHIPHVRFALETQLEQQQQHEQQQQQQAKPVPKKRLAHIEALLQSSVAPDLRGRMEHLRGSWVDSQGSALDPVQLQHSFEEKTLALELLLLSPATVPPPAPTNDKRCAACMGRLVFHSCGKRDMPVDHDAIERADREREQQEQAEKQRIKIRKRKEAEARRKEAKRLRRMEEERQRELEEQRRREQMPAPVVVTKTPLSPYHGSTFNINGNQVHSSTSLHPTDALAALAGLADSFAQPMQYTTTQQETDSSPLDLLSSASAQVSQVGFRTTVDSLAQPKQAAEPKASLVLWSSDRSLPKAAPSVDMGASDRRGQETTRLTASVQIPEALDLLSFANDQAPKASVSRVGLEASGSATVNIKYPPPVCKNNQQGSGSKDSQDPPLVYRNGQEHGFNSNENPSVSKSRVLSEEVANGHLLGGEALKNGVKSSDTATDAVSALVMLCGAADPARGLSIQPHETSKTQVNGEHSLYPFHQSELRSKELSKENSSAVDSKSSPSVAEMSTHHPTNGYDVTAAVEKTSFPASTVPTPELSKDDEDSSVDRLVDKAAMKGTDTVSATKVKG